MILLTGGTGYIASHTCIALMEAGYDVVLFDNFYNSSPEVLNRIEIIVGKKPKFYKADLCDQSAMEQIFMENDIEAVIHFAGLKAVGESVEKPLFYYHVNVEGTLTLLDAMVKADVKKIVFSSSATVYGMHNAVPYTEDMLTGRCANPYGQTKVAIENILQDVAASDSKWGISLLRYFNPVGAHESGLIGEDPNGVPQNLCPFIAQVAIGKREKLLVCGNDYDTPDGTGVRDYIHVQDLAQGHVAALKRLIGKDGVDVYNLGTGKGVSVLEMRQEFSNVCGRDIPYEIVARRAGDLASAYADTKKAKEELNWEAKKDCHSMCEDLWRWQQKNPNGYQSK